MNFIGIDLAWKVLDSPRIRTGLAVTDDGYLADAALAATDDEILAFVAKYVGDSCAVGIDAPLVVSNETGQRPVENLLLRRGISAYPANRSLFNRLYGGIRGEVLLCAYIIYRYYLDRTSAEVIGDLNTGYILLARH